MNAKNTSYGQVLNSSLLIGGSSLINIAFGMVRSKAMALLLGPAGVGFLGMYSLIIDLCVCVAGLGINNSGVRQIAEANTSDNVTRVAQTATVLRWISVALGLAGGLGLALFAVPLSRLTFSDTGYAASIALLGIAVFFRLAAAGQSALILGLRRISDLALLGIYAAFFSTVLSIAIIYIWRDEGIVPSLVCGAGAALLVSWWYTRKVPIAKVSVTSHEMASEARPLVALGVAFMVGELLTMATAYFIRLMLFQHEGSVGAGLYQAAWTLGGLYTGFVLQAMGADFYPRLTASATDDEKCNQLINEQTEIGMLLAAPGLIGTLVFAPLILTIFYSSEFSPAAIALRWICLGMALRIVTWPMGYLLIARNARRLFIAVEIAAAVVQMGFAFALVPFYGVDGAGAAFVGLYLWHTTIVYLIVRRMSGFRFSRANVALISIMFAVIILVLASFTMLNFWPAMVLGVVATCAISIYSIVAIVQRVPPEDLPGPLRRFAPLMIHFGRAGS